jgi:hypothetical protein
MLSPQDFARLLQTKLIEAGEDRPLEFRADLFGFVPRGGDLGAIFPLDHYYRQYLAAASDGERQRVVKQFTTDWLRHAKRAAPVAPGSGGAPASFSPSPFSGLAVGIPPVRPAAYAPSPSSAGGAGCGIRVALVIFGLVGMAFVCFCATPLALMGVAKNGAGRPGFPGGPRWGREWDFHPPADARSTEMVGGHGGGPRFYYDDIRRPVIGLAFSTDEWFGQQAIRALVPLYDDHSPPPEDHFHPLVPVRGKEGYVVGGLEVDSGEFVNAVRIKFVRRTDKGLDPSDTYQSDWLGTPTPGRETRQLLGEGEEVLGIAARQGIILDSVGLLFRPAAKPPEPMPPPPAENSAQNPFESAPEVPLSPVPCSPSPSP